MFSGILTYASPSEAYHMQLIEALQKLIHRLFFEDRSCNATSDRFYNNLCTMRKSLAKLLEDAVSMKSPQQPNKLLDVEFQVFSQWGEDGIIQYFLRHVDVPNNVFLEFGVENYQEANTRWLLEGHNWSGVILDGSESNINEIKGEAFYWKHDLKAVCSFVNAENINTVIRESGLSGEIGLLSVDIDGMDYWVWKAIDAISPAIVVVEYNSLFGPDRQVTVPYDASFSRQSAHYSWSYYGASLAALVSLGQDKGYAFVGSNSAGNNAFFVRQDLMKAPLQVLSATEGYVKRKFREARDQSGHLAFPSFEQEAELIRGLPLVEIN